MQGRFEFLENTFPKLAEYGKKAEECLNSDNNICLLNLGRIAEHVTDILSRRNNITPGELSQLGVIDDGIQRKITALTDTKHDAEDGYDSQMACERLLVTAHELCEWLMSRYGESRFEFLADLFPSSEAVPPLAALSECGREAEENLYSNTRYSLICLGDIGENIANILLTNENIQHDKDQIDRIRMLTNRGIITKQASSTLHKLRMTRNNAIHGRYGVLNEARILIDDALELCEKLFMLTVKSDDVLRGRIARADDGKIFVNIGRLSGVVDEIPTDAQYSLGEKRMFRVAAVDDEKITLCMTGINSDPWAVMSRHYERYSEGQELNAEIKRLTKSLGAVVSLRDGLEARIPDSELGRRIYNRRKGIKYEVKARVKWLDPEHYPYMLLSVKDIEDEQKHETNEDTPRSEAMPDVYFLEFCKTAEADDVRAELEKGANANSRNKKGMTPLMLAATYNEKPGVVTALIDGGAKVDAKNYKGNTGLIFAAMYNGAEIVSEFIEGGADVDAQNSGKRTAGYYALRNKKLRRDKELLTLLHCEIPEETKPKTPIKTLNARLLKTCRNGSVEDVRSILDEGADINARTTNKSTPLMMAAEHGNIDVVKFILGRKPDIDAKNSVGNTALHISAANNHPQVMNEILAAGALWDIPNKRGVTAYDTAKSMASFRGTEAMKKMMLPELQRGFLRLCRSGSAEDISSALEAGVNPDTRNSTGATALIFAARSNTADAVDALIKAGADPDAQDIHANTALIYAASYNSDDVVDALIGGGADVNVINNLGYKAVNYARQNYRLQDTDALRALEELTHD